jgi:hypothetical protein
MRSSWSCKRSAVTPESSFYLHRHVREGASVRVLFNLLHPIDSFSHCTACKALQSTGLMIPVISACVMRSTDPTRNATCPGIGTCRKIGDIPTRIRAKLMTFLRVHAPPTRSKSKKSIPPNFLVECCGTEAWTTASSSCRPYPWM